MKGIRSAFLSVLVVVICSGVVALGNGFYTSRKALLGGAMIDEALEQLAGIYPSSEEAVPPDDGEAVDRTALLLSGEVESVEVEELLGYTTLKYEFILTLMGGATKYAYYSSSSGRNGKVNFLPLLDDQGRLENIAYISHMETPGLGSRIEEEEFVDRLLGQQASSLEAEVISGASYSSNAVFRGVREAGNRFEEGQE